MRIAICDDEIIYINELSGFLKNYAQRINHNDYSISGYTSGKKLLAEYRHGMFDLIFLDVFMPYKDGFEVAEQIRMSDLDVLIVFVTSAADQMHVSFRVSASDYIIKPIHEMAINLLMDRLVEILRRKKFDKYHIKLKGGGETVLSLSDILFLESRDHYIQAVTLTNCFEYYGALSQEEILLREKGFVRVHQSYLINMAHIFILFGDHASMINGAKIPLSRKYKKSTKIIFDKFRKGSV